MKIILDDKPCDVEATTVGEAIDAAASLVQERGRLIVDVSVDGAPWTETQLNSRQVDVTAEVVRLITADPVELVRETFADAAEALSDADELQREAAHLLQSDQHPIALDKLNDAISIWLQVQAAIVTGSQLAGLALDEAALARPIAESICTLNERLEGIRSALVGEDPIGLADSLLYEFPDVVEEWRSILDALRRRVESQTQ